MAVRAAPRIALFERREDRRVLVLDEAEAGIGAQHPRLRVRFMPMAMCASSESCTETW